MNEIIYPEEREMRKIQKKITKKDFRDIIDAIEKFLQDGDPSSPFGSRIKDLQNQYRFPQYRLRSGDFRVLYNVETRLLGSDIVYIIDIIPKKEWDMWLRTYGVKK
jgi:mRNA-degrading endonuclease RelE of RelBE toxin-antitoxin system